MTFVKILNLSAIDEFSLILHWEINSVPKILLILDKGKKRNKS